MERQATFCARIKAAREESGVSLEQISTSAKISVSLLKGLEAADLSRWPKELSPAAYFRDYVRAVGLSSESNMAEFVRLLPNEAVRLPTDQQGSDEVSTRSDHPYDIELAPLSLVLNDDRSAKTGSNARTAGGICHRRRRGSLAVRVGSVSPPCRHLGEHLATVTFAYYFIATVSVGRSFGARWMANRSSTRWRKAATPTAPESVGDPLHHLHELSVRGRGTVGDGARPMERCPPANLVPSLTVPI